MGQVYLREAMRLLRAHPSGVALIAMPLGEGAHLVKHQSEVNLLCGASFNATTGSAAAVMLHKTSNDLLILLAKGKAARTLQSAVKDLPMAKPGMMAKLSMARYNRKHVTFNVISQMVLALPLH